MDIREPIHLLALYCDVAQCGSEKNVGKYMLYRRRRVPEDIFGARAGEGRKAARYCSFVDTAASEKNQAKNFGANQRRRGRGQCGSSG